MTDIKAMPVVIDPRTSRLKPEQSIAEQKAIVIEDIGKLYAAYLEWRKAYRADDKDAQEAALAKTRKLMEANIVAAIIYMSGAGEDLARGKITLDEVGDQISVTDRNPLGDAFAGAERPVYLN